MHTRVIALSALAIAGLPATEAFGAAPGCVLRCGSPRGTALSRAALQLRAPPRPARAAALALTADTGVPEGQKAFEAGERSLDEWFEMLADR
jgi:hypothetical protein